MDEIQAIRDALGRHEDHLIGDAAFRAEVEWRLDTIEKRAAFWRAALVGTTGSLVVTVLAFVLGRV